MDLFALFAGFLAIAFIVLLAYVVIGMLIRLFSDGGGQAVANALGSRGLWSAIQNTATLLATSVPIALAIGTAFAWLNERTDAAMGWLSRLLPLLPFLLPPVALGIGWVFLGSETAGYLNTFIQELGRLVGLEVGTPFNIGTMPGLVMVYVMNLVPFSYLITAAALRNVDSAEDEASRMSGAGVLRTALKVSFPAILPAIGSAVLLMVVTGLALYSIPAIVGSHAQINVLSVHIVRLVNDSYPPQLAEAAVLSLFVFIVVASFWMLQRWIASRSRHSTIGGKSTGHSLVQMGRWKWPARGVMIAYLLATSVLPAAALLLVSLQTFWSPEIRWTDLSLDNFKEVLAGNSQTGRALVSSGLLGTTGATLGMIIAAVLMVYARQRGGGTSRLIDGATKGPAATTNLVLGVAFLVSLAGAPFYLRGTLLILLLAYIVVYMPEASIAAGAANEQIGGDLLEASHTSGASGGRTFRRITLPLMMPGLAAGWALLFVRMAGDLTVSALLAGTRTPVVGFVILAVWENGIYPTLAALAFVITVFSAGIVGGVFFLTRQKRGRSGMRRLAEEQTAAG